MDTIRARRAYNYVSDSDRQGLIEDGIKLGAFIEMLKFLEMLYYKQKVANYLVEHGILKLYTNLGEFSNEVLIDVMESQYDQIHMEYRDRLNDLVEYYEGEGVGIYTYRDDDTGHLSLTFAVIDDFEVDDDVIESFVMEPITPEIKLSPSDFTVSYGHSYHLRLFPVLKITELDDETSDYHVDFSNGLDVSGLDVEPYSLERCYADLLEKMLGIIQTHYPSTKRLWRRYYFDRGSFQIKTQPDRYASAYKAYQKTFVNVPSTMVSKIDRKCLMKD